MSGARGEARISDQFPNVPFRTFRLHVLLLSSDTSFLNCHSLLCNAWRACWPSAIFLSLFSSSIDVLEVHLAPISLV